MYNNKWRNTYATEGHGAVILKKYKMNDNVPDLTNSRTPQIQEAQRTLTRINLKKTLPQGISQSN